MRRLIELSMSELKMSEFGDCFYIAIDNLLNTDHSYEKHAVSDEVH